MKKFLVLLLTMAVLVSTAGCSSNPKQSSSKGSIAAIKSAGTIRIGIFSDDAPFCYQDTDGKYKGYDVEFGKRIAKELLGNENKITWVAMNPADRIPYLQTNKVDLMLADFTVTTERAKSVDFTLPYEKVSVGVVSSVKTPITSVDQLKGKTLVVTTGTTEDAYFAQHGSGIKIIKEDAITDGYQALTTGKADAFSQDNTLLLSWAKKNPEYTVGITNLGDPSYIAGAVRKGNTELLNYVNHLIKGKLKDEQFFHTNYNETLKASFPDSTIADQIVVEGGVTQ